MQGPAASASNRLEQLAPALGGVCGDYLAMYRKELEAAVREGRGGLDVAGRFSRILDGLLSALFCAARAAEGKGLTGRIALVAVGGYGRGLVALHSDVDVLVLAEQPEDPKVAAVMESLLYPLWDLGLSLGHAVRGVQETLDLARTDVRTATTLLDVRCVAGDRDLVEELHAGCRRHVFEPALRDFIVALGADLEERHERYGGSLYLLEPEVKMGRGGIRDLDVAVWAARARWSCQATHEFVAAGALLAREVEELEGAREFLWRVRNRLHLRAGRRQDRLTFEDQEEIAPAMGFLDGDMLGVERFMQAYYRHAQIVAQTAERMLARALPETRTRRQAPIDQGDGTLVFDDHVTFVDTTALEQDPSLALRLYQQVVRTGFPPYAYARDAVARTAVERRWGEALRASAPSSEAFLQLLCHHGQAPVRRGSVLGELHEMGLMLAMIPEFEPVTGRVQHDVYHVYTVDVHSVAAVDRLHELVRGDLKAEYPLPCRLAAEMPRPVPLFLGLLLHDIGKAHGKDHAEKGAIMAGPIAKRLGLSEADQRHVEWLVREHLSLYHWATRRDTSDPDTLQEIAERIGTPERLRDLYLLTFADLSTTNPQAMTAWKARMFEDLYVRLVRCFEGKGGEGRAAELRAQAEASFSPAEPGAVERAFVASMPDRYVLAHGPDAMRRHARLAALRGAKMVHVECAPAGDGESFDVIVVTDDRPGLLADVAVVLAANRLTVGRAEIYTRARRGQCDEAFDLFSVRKHGGGLVDVHAVADRIAKDLEALWDGITTVADLLARLPKTPVWAQRRTPGVRTEVVIDNDASGQFTVVDVFTKDRLGLLHLIARALHEEGLSIALSKVSTEGDRAADVFYVRDAGGGKVTDGDRLRALSEHLKGLLTDAAEAAPKGEG